MDDSSIRNFDRVCSYVGWGDPEPHGLWFIGLEEGGEPWESQTQIEKWFARGEKDSIRIEGPVCYDPCQKLDSAQDETRFRGYRTRIPHWEAKIAVQVSASAAPAHDYREYMNKKLWRPESRVFHSNLYPLAKPNLASWPAHYSSLFGYGSDQREQYRSDVQRNRFVKLADYRALKAPAATICFGITGRADFAAVTRLGDATWTNSLGGKIRIFEAERVILTPFFGQGMSGIVANQIAETLRDWKIELP